MITFKSEEDFSNMDKAGTIVATIHSELREASTPGTTLTTLDNIAKNIVEKSGSISSFLGYRGYPSYICASPNDVIVHGIPGNYSLKDGDILSIDVGVSVNGYHADAALTYGIGDISDENQKLIKVTKDALYAGIKLVGDGNKLGTIGNKIEKIGKKEHYGVVKEYVGHGIGLEMHEDPQVPNYGKKNQGFTLKKGMAICIEPMFNIGSAQTKIDDDEWTVRTFDGSNSAHFEHTIGIMDNEIRIFTEK
jgi:methionyl aminopeptidase